MKYKKHTKINYWYFTSHRYW